MFTATDAKWNKGRLKWTISSILISQHENSPQGFLNVYINGRWRWQSKQEELLVAQSTNLNRKHHLNFWSSQLLSLLKQFEWFDFKKQCKKMVCWSLHEVWFFTVLKVKYMVNKSLISWINGKVLCFSSKESFSHSRPSCIACSVCHQ